MQMKLFELNQQEEYLIAYRDQRIEEANKTIIDEKTKEIVRLEISYVRDMLAIIRKYKKEVAKL
jgi:uncharacterized membrane protein YgaE (UPF0421/DUF939 family)